MDTKKINTDNIEDIFFMTEKGQVYSSVITNIEKKLIEKALAHFYGNQLRAAKVLGINRNTLHSKIKKLGIYVEKFKS